MCKPYQNKWKEGGEGRNQKGEYFKMNVNRKGAKTAITL